MNEEIIEILKGLENISTPTGISYSGDITINNDDVKILEDYITNLQQKVEQQEKEIDRLNYIKSKATNYLIKAIKIDSEDDNCMCLKRHEYKILLDMLLKRELKGDK